MSFNLNGHITHLDSRHEASYCCSHNSTSNKSFVNSETKSRTVCTKMQDKYTATATNRWTKNPSFSVHQMFCLVLCGILTFLSHTVCAFNLDAQNPVRYTGPRGSYFGYSVLLHENYQGKW